MIQVYNKTGRILIVAGIAVPPHTLVEIDTEIDSGVRSLMHNGFIEATVIKHKLPTTSIKFDMKQAKSKGKTVLLEELEKTESE